MLARNALIKQTGHGNSVVDSTLCDIETAKPVLDLCGDVTRTDNVAANHDNDVISDDVEQLRLEINTLEAALKSSTLQLKVRA